MVQNALNDLSKPHFYLFGARNATIYIYIYIYFGNNGNFIES